jgi:hypothetical protein
LLIAWLERAYRNAFRPHGRFWRLVKRHLHPEEVAHRVVPLVLKQRAGRLVGTVDPVVEDDPGLGRCERFMRALGPH